MSTQMYKLKRSYSEKAVSSVMEILRFACWEESRGIYLNVFMYLQGIQLPGLRFLFDGRRITDDDTPKSVSVRRIYSLYEYEVEVNLHWWTWLT